MPYRLPRSVAHVVTDGELGGSATRLRVSLLRLPDGVPVVLEDASALIWIVAVEGSDDIVGDVAAGAGQPTHMVREDVETFLAALEGEGLIEWCDGAAQSAGGDG